METRIQSSPSPLGRLDRFRNQSLTARQRGVLQLVTLGFTNKQIAGTLHLHIETVKTHIAALLKRCGATSRTQLAVIGIQFSGGPGKEIPAQVLVPQE